MMERILDDISRSMYNQKGASCKSSIYYIQKAIPSSNDQTSVNAWVQELTNMPYNSILGQGKIQDDRMNDVGVVLCVQTELQ